MFLDVVILLDIYIMSEHNRLEYDIILSKTRAY